MGHYMGVTQSTPMPIFYPKVPVSIQCRVLQRISSSEALVTPLCLLGLSSSTFECTQADASCECPESGHVGEDVYMKDVRIEKLGIIWRQKNSKRQFTKLDQIWTDTQELHNVIEVVLLM